jgi:hypothetical protein
MGVRRPSAATPVALLALFVALGGPAEARRLIDGGDIRAGTVRSKQLKDHTIALRDLNPVVVRQLRLTPNSSITESKLAPGAVTSGRLGAASVNASKLAANAVGAAAIADGAVNGAKVADGSLTTADVARFAGRFRITAANIGTILPNTCWRGVPQGLAPELAGADISRDALLVTQLGGEDLPLTLTARTNASGSQFVLALCNVAGQPVTPAGDITFSYVVFDVP